MPEHGTTPVRKKSALLANMDTDPLFQEVPVVHRRMVKPTTVNAVGIAKGTQYLAAGRDIPGDIRKRTWTAC
eukprot:7746200-Pyramimonas_sp.AAC.3